MSRYLYKKIQNISPESLNFQHSGLKLTTLGSDRASSKGYIVRWVEAPSNKLLTTAFEASLESVAVTSVSYTHLEKLKKSYDKILTEDDIQECFRGDYLILDMKKTIGKSEKIYPVSYTHLDVYKRQVQMMF